MNESAVILLIASALKKTQSDRIDIIIFKAEIKRRNVYYGGKEHKRK